LIRGGGGGCRRRARRLLGFAFVRCGFARLVAAVAKRLLMRALRGAARDNLVSRHPMLTLGSRLRARVRPPPVHASQCGLVVRIVVAAVVVAALYWRLIVSHAEWPPATGAETASAPEMFPGGK
jgi:hypothetical protein